MCNTPPDSDALWVATVYLHPSDDDNWVNELRGLLEDIRHIRVRNPDARIVVMGDFNFEPPTLHMDTTSSSRRLSEWIVFVKDSRLCLANPPRNATAVTDIRLPIRDRLISVAPGSTRHGPSMGRCIGLILHSENVSLEVSIHNGVHCKVQSHCPWAECIEAGGGDHFWIEVRVVGDRVFSQTRTTNGFPFCWHDGERWKAGLDKFTPLLA